MDTYKTVDVSFFRNHRNGDPSTDGPIQAVFSADRLTKVVDTIQSQYTVSMILSTER